MNDQIKPNDGSQNTPDSSVSKRHVNRPQGNVILSGGQAGVEQTALDVAIALGIPHGGWCPLKRRTENGTVPVKYNLVETRTPDYKERTFRNIKDSDGILMVSQLPLQEKAKEVQEYAVSNNVPIFIADPTRPAERNEFSDWIKSNNIVVLFITGLPQSREAIPQKAIFSFIRCLIMGTLKGFDLEEMDIEDFCQLQTDHDKAFSWLTSKMEEVMKILTKNPSRTMEVFQKRALSGNAVDLFRLGVLYHDGEIVEQDMEKAVSYFMQAACLGHVKSKRCLAECFRTGRGVPQNQTAAFNWLRNAAESGDTVAQCNLGAFYGERHGNPSQIFRWSKEAAVKGNIKAMCNLGKCYFNGYGVEQDIHSAFQWYSRAAEGGMSDALVGLYLCYTSGKLIEEEIEKGLECLEQAVEKGNVTAIYQKGVYLRRTGKPDEALEYFQKAVHLGYEPALYDLGKAWYDGHEDNPNDQKALEYFLKSAENGHADSMFMLALCYLQSRGVEYSREKAVDWLAEAAALGHAEAKQELDRLSRTDTNQE